MKKVQYILFPCIALLSFVFVASGQTPTLYSTTVSNDTPLLYWNFDAGTGNASQQMPVAVAQITTQNNLVPIDGATRVSHASLDDGLKLGNAAALNGSNYFYAASMFTGAIALTNAFAVEFWMQSLATNTATYLYNIGNNAGDIIYNFNPDNLELYAGAGGRTGTSGPQITDTNWHYVLCVYYGSSFKDLADEVDFYVDVTNFYAVQSLNVNASLPLNQTFIFGAATTVPQNAFDGNLDEFAIYDLSSYTDLGVAQTAMTNMAVAHRFAATNSSSGTYSNAVVASGPYLYWNFDETSGAAEQLMPITPPPLNNALNDLVPGGQATYVTHASLNDGLQLGDAAQLNGASWFSTAGPLISGLPGSLNGPWAVEFWMQDTVYPQSDRYLLEADGNDNIPSIIYGYSGENIEGFGPGGRSGANGIPINDENWHYLLLVNYDTAPAGSTNRVDFFIDGLQHSNTGGGFNTAFAFADTLWFGSSYNGGGAYTGNLDELAIYNLSAFTNVAGVQAQATTMSAKHYAAAFGISGITNIQQLDDLVTINQQPASTNSQVGGTASFTVGATVSNQLSAFPIGYQWQVNGESILGATNASYAIPKLTLNNIGTNAYTVRVSAGPAFQISAPANLVVPAPAPAPPTAYDQSVLQTQPLLYWNFDENTGPAVEQVPVIPPLVTNQNDLIPINGATRVSHASLGDGLNLGNAASLSGNNYFYVTNLLTGQTAITNAFAVEFWMQSLASNSGTYLYNIGNNAAEMIYNFNPDYLEFYAGGGGRTGTSGPQITDTNWHYIMCVYYGSASQGLANEVDIYVDVTNYHAVTNLNIASSMPLNQQFIFGAGTTVPNNAFNGNLDEFAIYNLSSYTSLNQARTAITNMVVAHMFAATNSSAGSYSNAVVASAPYLYWNFDETDGLAAEVMPIQIHLNPVDNELVESGGAGLVQQSLLGDGLYLGNAADLDGTSVFYAAQLDAGRTLVSAPWAVEFWMQSLATNSDAYLLDFGPSSPNGVQNEPGFIFNYTPLAPAGELDMCAASDTPTAGNITASGVTITDTNWHHVVWVDYGDGTTGVTNSSGTIDDRVDLYLDGTNYPNVQNTFSSALDAGHEVIVGGAQPGYLEFQGRMDEIAVYDLSAFSNENAVTADITNLVALHAAAALVAPPPSLSIALTGGQLIVNWSGVGYVLQENSNLANKNGWSNLTNGNTSPVVIPQLPSSSTFYRLINQ